MKKRYSILLIIITFILPQLTAQSKNFTIQGIVQDALNKDSLVGVTILVKEKKTGVTSNTSGRFRITLPEGKYILAYSYTGYEASEILIDLHTDQTLNISLTPSVTSIDEVKVIGQRKFFGNMEYGREIPTISAKTIEKQNSGNASDILHASIAGVWATKTSGSPGDHQKIRIRGQSSFFSSAEPLYVIDGVPVPIVNMSSLGIADLNTHDIENVTILKDASSTALYGFQGGNGVVLIDTKKGGENEISFSTKGGVLWFDNFYDLMNTNDFLASLQLAKNNIGSNLYNYYPQITDNPSNDNWQKEIFRTGTSQEYQLSASGEVKATKYYISGNFTNQKGILPNAGYKRYTVSSRFSRIFWKKLAIDAGYRGSVQDNADNQDIYMGNPLLFEGITTSPCIASTPDSLYHNEHGIPYKRIYYQYEKLNKGEQVKTIIANNSNRLRINSHIINGSARVQLTSHLSLNAMESLMFRYSNYNFRSNSVVVKSNEDVFLYNHQYNISYFNTFGKHKVDLVAAYRLYEDNLWWKVDTMEGELNSYSYLRNSMAAYGPNGSVIRSIASYVANASYNYNETYFVSVVSNLSRIKEGLHIDYYSLFPSLALSWDIAREWPFKKIGWLNNFNLFANWGKSGNYPLNGLSNDLYEKTQYTYGTTTGTYPAVLQLANHNLKHESTEELDYGIKTSILNRRLSITSTYYKKTINNLIAQRQIPRFYNGGMQYVNVGEISVNGKEFGIEANPVRMENFTWFFKFNISMSSQKVEKMLDGKPIVFIGAHEDGIPDILMPKFVIKEGQSIGDIYGYKKLGRWTFADTKAKDIRYVNVDGIKYINTDTSNRIIDANDKVVIENSIPKYSWNLSNTFQYKDFSIDMLWYAVQGVHKYNATRAATIIAGINRDVNRYLTDSIKEITSAYFYQTSEFIDDASFIRLKTVTLNYEPAKEFFGYAKLRVSLSFENFITITKYKGYDPEATTFTDNNFSDNAIDRGAVPNPKAVYATIGISF